MANSGINVESSYQNLANQVGELVKIGRETLDILSNARGSVEDAKTKALKELIAKAEELQGNLMVSAYDYERESAPNASVNPKKNLAKWLDLTTGAVYVCRDNTPDHNVWVTFGTDVIRELQQIIEDLTQRVNLKIESISGNGFDYIKPSNPAASTNPTKDSALWLNTESGMIYVCIDKTPNNNIWKSGSSYIGGVFEYFGKGYPTEETQGVFYLNILTQEIFIKHQDAWVKMASLKVVDTLDEITLEDKVLYVLNTDLFYKDKATVVFKLDYVFGAAPRNDVNPQKDYALALDKSAKRFYVCIDRTENANIWEIMEIKENEIDVPNISKPIIVGKDPLAPGFGGGIPSDKALLRLGLEKLDGSDDPESPNWSQYIHKQTESIMCYTPLMYHKLSFEPGPPYYGLKVEFSATKKEGYTLNRSFYNGGKIIEGFFTDKFHCSLGENNIPASKKDAIPLSMSRNYNGFAQCGPVSGSDGKARVVDYVDMPKKRGYEFFLMPIYVRNYWLLLMCAKYQASYSANDLSSIAWCDTVPHYVRGGNNGLKDCIDNTVVYASTGDGRGGKTGGVSGELNLKKISILGDGTSPCDFNGVMQDICMGMNGDGVKTGLFKKNVDTRVLGSVSISSSALYDYFTPPFEGVGRFGDGTEQVLHCASEEDTDAWRMDCLLIPKAQYTSSSEFLRGGITMPMPSGNLPLAGSFWNGGNTKIYGFSSVSRSLAECPHSGDVIGYSVGFRACAVGETVG